MLYLCLTKHHHKGERWHSSTHP